MTTGSVALTLSKDCMVSLVLHSVWIQNKDSSVVAGVGVAGSWRLEILSQLAHQKASRGQTAQLILDRAPMLTPLC